MCLFMCKRNFKHCYDKCVEKDTKENRHRKTHAKKAKTYFCSQPKISRFQTSFTKILFSKLFELRQPIWTICFTEFEEIGLPKGVVHLTLLYSTVQYSTVENKENMHCKIFVVLVFLHS